MAQGIEPTTGGKDGDVIVLLSKSGDCCLGKLHYSTRLKETPLEWHIEKPGHTLALTGLVSHGYVAYVVRNFKEFKQWDK